MSEALAYNRTVPAYPLGQPVDGRPRYGMTPEQAFVYRWVVRNRPHDRPFTISFRQLATFMASTSGNVHSRVIALVERGWLQREDAGYRLVHPVMTFRGKRDA
jgi:DNA-binding MarR family transcriptional regulator